MAIQKINEENFNEIVNNNRYVLVKFGATWCGPCKMMAPVLNSLSDSGTSAVIAEVDIDESEDLTKRHGIMSVPTTLLFKRGEIVETKIGFVSEQELNNLIEKQRKLG